MKLTDQGEYTLQRLKGEFAAWSTKMANADSPLYELQWGDEAVRVAARLHVLGLVSNCKMETMADLTAYTSGMIARMAGSPHRSTSPMSNLAHQEELAAWVWLSELMEQYVAETKDPSSP